MLWTPANPGYQLIFDNRAADTVSAGANNTKGDWIEQVSTTECAYDVYAIHIMCANIGANAVLSQCLFDVGVDPAGGGSYEVLIPNLMGSNAGSPGVGAWITYYFPLFIRAGSQIGVRAQTNNASNRNFSTGIRIFGRPKYPHLARAGAYVTAIGADTATSAGVAVTPGNAAKGVYADLAGGTPTARDHWFWEFGFGINDTTFTGGNRYENDLAIGDASNKQIIYADETWFATTNEQLGRWTQPFGGYHDTPAGMLVYGRSACQAAAPDANCFMAAYGVGG